MIVLDFQPFSVVEDSGFREFAQALDASFDLPSRKSLAGDMLLTKYND
jgi:hypothetical protein